MEVLESTSLGVQIFESNGTLPLSDMSQQFWNDAVTAAAKACSGNNSDQLQQFYSQIKRFLEPYKYKSLIVTLEDWGGGYRSITQMSSDTTYRNYSLHDGQHFYQAWVIN